MCSAYRSNLRDILGGRVWAVGARPLRSIIMGRVEILVIGQRVAWACALLQLACAPAHPGEQSSSVGGAPIGSGGPSSASGGSTPATSGGTTSGGAPSGSASGGQAATASGGAAGSSAGAGVAGSAGATAGTGTCSLGGSSALYCVDFESDATGKYQPSELDSDFENPVFSNGIAEGRVSVIQTDKTRGRSLRVLYPKDGYGPDMGGALWRLDFAESYEELYVSYWVRFESKFEWVGGGKLPGLTGGAANSGGNKPTGMDGFSARMAWREQGAAVQYMYYMDQPGEFGDDFIWSVHDAPAAFIPGTWHHVVHHVVMNTEGLRNGVLEAWFDGSLALKHNNVRYRAKGANFAIDAFYFSTFFGGDGPEWAPSSDQYIYFDDIVISKSMPAL